MGAEVIIFGQSLNSHFLRGLTHSAMLSTSFLMSEQFEGSYGNYKLEKGILHVNYVLKCFPVETT